MITASLIVGLFLCELAVRILKLSVTYESKQRTSAHHQIIKKYITPSFQSIGYRFVANAQFTDIFNHSYQINNQGFRSAPSTSAPLFNFFGDSVFEGFGVAYDASAFNLFKNIHPKSNNYSMQGYGLLDIKHTLTKILEKQISKHTIIQLCFNDVTDLIKRSKNKDFNSQNPKENWLKKHFQNFALYLFLAEKKHYFDLKNNKADFFLNQQHNISNQILNQLKDELQQLKEICHSKGSTLHILYSPYRSEVIASDEVKALKMHQNMQELCLSIGLPYIGPTPYFRENNSKELFVDHVHLNERGNKLLSEHLINYFSDYSSKE